MLYTIDLLLGGDERVVMYYVAAKSHWQNILASNDSKAVDTLALRLTQEQFWFENHCGGRWQGQEVMAFAGIGHLYDQSVGFDLNRDLVLRLFDAFMESFCSLEVKWHAQRAAESYRLKDLREEASDE